jgi:UDP:flavonoid glycosyltransferase YjiC (YdhE family)
VRVLFTPVTATSTPLFHMVMLAWAFRAAGHEVRVAAQPELTPVTIGVGLTAVEVGHGYDIMAGIIEARGGRRVVESSMTRVVGSGLADSTRPGGPSTFANRPTGEQRRLQDLRFGPIVKATAAIAPDLLRFAERWQPQLVISDPLVFAAPLVSETLRIPLVRHLWGPDIWRRLSHPMQGEPADGEVREQWPTGLAEIYDQYGVVPRNDYATGSVDPWPGSLQLPGTPGRIPMRFVPYNGAAAAPDWVLDRPSRPRVCVTWGRSTAAVGGDEAFVLPRVVAALAPLDIEVVLAVSGDDREKLGEVPGNVRIAENLPLHLLMPTCDAIVNQGGSSSLLTAACYGLPQVMVPQTADSPFNAANFSASGAGITVDVTQAGTKTIGSAVMAALTDETIRSAARKVRDEIAATPPPSDVVHTLEDLV